MDPAAAQAFDEKTFDAQFSDWEKQYDSWKEQNKNHPDKAAFDQYDQQWQTWKAQLLERRSLFLSMKNNTAVAAGRYRRVSMSCNIRLSYFNFKKVEEK